MRTVTFETNYLLHPQGSCLVSFGNTKVICTASVEQTVPPFLQDTGQGWITAEYSMLPGSTPGGRKRRELMKPDGRSTEIRRLIGRSLRSAVHLEKLGSISIIIDCDVIQADGGTRTAAISGGWVALYIALKKIADEQGAEAPDLYLRGQVAAVSVGIVGGKILCDLDYKHDANAEVDMNVVKCGGELVEVQGTGEKDTFSRDQLNALLDAAEEGIERIFTEQRKAIANG